MERNKRIVEIRDGRALELSEQELAAAIDPGPVDEFGFLATRELEDGRWLAVEPQTFNRARLGVSALHSLYGGGVLAAFAHGYADVFDYESREDAIAAMELWSGTGEPEGWIRHLRTGRRRQGDGSIRVRQTDIPGHVLEQLREAVRNGAGHECEEWILERSGQCALCGQRSAGEPIRELRELTPEEARRALDRVFTKKVGEP